MRTTLAIDPGNTESAYVVIEAAMRRGVEAAVREKVARRIFEEEQACSAALAVYPLSPYLSGKLSGLQRARDLAEGGDL